MPPELLAAADVAASGAAIESVQEPSGAIPWTAGGHADVWNHVEAAMALLVAGRIEAVDRAWSWVRPTQRADGSWPMKVVAAVVEDASGDTNMSAYVAVGVWHHWLVRRELGFVVAHWPAVRRRSTTCAGSSSRSAASPGPRSGTRGARAPSTPRRCWPARRASTMRCGPG